MSPCECGLSGECRGTEGHVAASSGFCETLSERLSCESSIASPGSEALAVVNVEASRVVLGVPQQHEMRLGYDHGDCKESQRGQRAAAEEEVVELGEVGDDHVCAFPSVTCFSWIGCRLSDAYQTPAFSSSACESPSSMDYFPLRRAHFLIVQDINELNALPF
jgi:hypothetical protein